MKTRIFSTAIAIALLLVASTTTLNLCQTAQTSETHGWSTSDFRSGSVAKMIIGLKDNVGEFSISAAPLNEIMTRHQANIVDTISTNDRDMAVVVELPLFRTDSFIQEALTSSMVKYVEPNWEWQIDFTPNDPSWSQQYGPRIIKADWAWNTTVGSKDVLVAVIDTGVDWDHPDLAPNYNASGYDWVNMDPNPMDDHGHGTHCAGIIAAVINNSMGIAGVSNVTIMAEKGLNSQGSGYSNWLANCIINATDAGADILSMSWGSYKYSKLIRDALKYAYGKGVLLIAAAGNDRANAYHYPAGYPEVISISATDSSDNAADFTNYGDWIELAAPGVSIYSTYWNDGYQTVSGTSMSCPHVAGVAALIWSRFPGKSRDWVRMQLRYSSDDLGFTGKDIYYGYGRVNAKKAVEQSPPAHDLAVYSWAPPPYVEPGTTGAVNGTVLNFGASDENGINVELKVNGLVVDSAVITSLSASMSTTVSLDWSPAVAGKYNVTLSISSVPGETSMQNNFVWKYIYADKPLKAVVLDSEGTAVGYETRNWDRLNDEWALYGTKMIYIDYMTLFKEDITYQDIANTGADMLIISAAWNKTYGWEFTDSEINAITQYVEEGHGIIMTDLTFYYQAPNNRKLAPLVGMSDAYTWNSTKKSSIQILEPQHPIFKGIPNPYNYLEVTTGLPPDGVFSDNELAGGRYVAKSGDGKAAIVVYKRSRVYLSSWFEGIDPYQHSNHLRLLYNAITWSPHELAAGIEAPSYLYLGSSTTLNATAFNIGAANETNVVLQLKINGSVVDSAVISTLNTGSSYTLNYPWVPGEGTYNVTTYVEPVVGESHLANNTASKIVNVGENRDVAITQIISPDWVYAGKPVNVTVIASNLGEFIETFDVTLYYNTTVPIKIGTQTVTDLLPDTDVTLIFLWNTAGMQPCQNRTLWAEATSVPGEGNLDNNVLIYGKVKIRMLGDIIANGQVDIYDVVAAAGAYGSHKGDPDWNPDADLVEPWGFINIFDIVAVTSRYGQKC